MILVDLNEWNVSFLDYADWCRLNQITVLRVTLTKYRLKRDDFLFFKLKFSKVALPSLPDYDEDEL